jgi:hypothetical protein
MAVMISSEVGKISAIYFSLFIHWKFISLMGVNCSSSSGLMPEFCHISGYKKGQ